LALWKSRSSKGASDSEANARRGVTRSILNTVVLLVSVGVLLGWASQGLYRLELGESAVILRLGKLDRIQKVEGWQIHWPPPLEYAEIVNTSGLRTESFGERPDRTTPGTPSDAEDREIAAQIKRNAIQTADSNIVNVNYELQYKVADAYSFAFGMAQPGAILHDATEATVRDVIGKKTIDAVLSQDRGEIERDSAATLQDLLDSYFQEVGLQPAFAIDKINLQKPQAPEPVREAFADVVSAGQDEKRATSAATGDAREILEQARAEAEELRQQAEAHKRAKIIEARGEATRFEALLTEYLDAPEVTRRRLYLETMEQILPGMEKVVVEPDTVNMLPVMPLGGGVGTRRGDRAAEGGPAQ
jgi:membrane protease subunit HflK